MTGVGLSFWRDVISTRYPVSRADEALRKVRLLARGPKPSAILRPLGLAPDITIPEPNTWREVVEVMRHRPERRLGIQEYGRPNPEFVEALANLGIHSDTFALYRWELPDDVGPLHEAVRRLISGEIEVVLFTSSIQLEHLVSVAVESGAGDNVLNVLRKDVAVASVGPIMNAALEDLGIKPDIIPQSPKMGALVKAAADESAAVLAGKRRSA
jgi:uroporphyrinogen-III synthase